MRLSQFQFNVEYIKGSDNVNSDFLSRLPLKETVEINEPFELIFSIKSLENMPITCHDIMLHTDRDQNLSKLKYYIQNGFPKNLDPELKQFKNFIDEISIVNECLMYKNRVYIP